MLFTLLIITLLATLLGCLLEQVARSLPSRPDALVERIDALLPQIQCAQCGYPGCRPYAEAIANHQVDIDRCPPGGEDTVKALAKLLDSDTRTLSAEFAQAKPLGVAVIDETRCIGCVLCIQACPVDAIVGAPRYMHTVIAAECTGCELCVSPCPVDCISMGGVSASSPGGA